MTVSRRTVFKGVLAGAGAAALPVSRERAVARPVRVTSGTSNGAKLSWGHGFEGQRKADLGNGTFLNPIVPGDHPGPTILKVGKDYYMTFSSFVSYPGVIIWHSRDLVVTRARLACRGPRRRLVDDLSRV